MSTTTDPNDALLFAIQPNGQQGAYLVLSEYELGRGFVRPFRLAYIHVGRRPEHPLRDLTPDELARYPDEGYVQYETYPSGSAATGRFWTQAKLDSGCGTVTTMATAIAETYAANPTFYGSTFCSACGKHFPVGEHGEFVWDGTEQRVGT